MADGCQPVTSLYENVICTVWINCMKNEQKKVQCDKLDQVAPPSKQLIVD